MAERTGTNFKAKPAAGTSDREVGNPEHDELVNWLIGHLPEVVKYQFGGGEDARRRKFEKAIGKWRFEFQEHLEKATEHLKGLAPGSPVAQPLTAMIERAQAALGSFIAPEPLDGLGVVSLSEWSSQHEVFARPARVGHPAKLVAFVDVWGSVLSGDNPQLSGSQFWPDLGNWIWTSDSRRSGSGWDPEANLIAKIEATKFSSPKWFEFHTKRDVFYDVRSELPTLAQTLQSLKTLRSHLGENAKVCLFAQEVPPLWRTVLPNEDFLVLTRSEISGMDTN